MVKKHIVRKRVNIRKFIKKNSSGSHASTTSSTTHKGPVAMSRLEYEQSMMDPRFRAVMMGFNNSGGNAQAQQVTQALHDKENRNNELMQQIAKQNELNEAKKKELELKRELDMTKLNNKSKLDAIKAENEIKRLQHEREADSDRKAYEEQISALKNELHISKQKHEKKQAELKQNQELAKTQHELKIQQINAAHADEINQLKSQTDELKKSLDIEQTKHDTAMKLGDAVKNEMIASFQASMQPIQHAIEKSTQKLKDVMELRDTQVRMINEIKDGLNKLEQMRVKADAQPVMHALESTLQDMNSKLSLNKEIYDELKKQRDVKIQIAQREQVVDDETRQKYDEKIKEQKMKTHELELVNAYAEHAHAALNETEAMRSKIIANGAALFPDFNPDELNDLAKFKKKLDAREIELRKQLVETSAQLEQSQRLLKRKRDIDELVVQREEAKARANAMLDDPNGEYMNDVSRTAKLKLELTHDTQKYNKLTEDLRNDANEKNKAILDNRHAMVEYLEANPDVKVEAERMANKRQGDMKGVITPDIVIKARTKVLGKYGELNEKMSANDEIASYNDRIAQLIAENEENHANLAEFQRRETQALAFIGHIEMAHTDEEFETIINNTKMGDDDVNFPVDVVMERVNDVSNRQRIPEMYDKLPNQ